MDADAMLEVVLQLRERYPDDDDFTAAMGRLAHELEAEQGQDAQGGGAPPTPEGES